MGIIRSSILKYQIISVIPIVSKSLYITYDSSEQDYCIEHQLSTYKLQ